MTDAEIPIARTPDFFRTAKALGDYINALPLTVEQNDMLVALAVAHVNAAEKSGCAYGLDMGAKIINAKEHDEL